MNGSYDDDDNEDYDDNADDDDKDYDDNDHFYCGNQDNVNNYDDNDGNDIDGDDDNDVNRNQSKINLNAITVSLPEAVQCKTGKCCNIQVTSELQNLIF